VKHVFVIGSGGREHAIYETLKRSPQPLKIAVHPGNAGTNNLALEPQNYVAWATQNAVDLVIIGPETPLAEGLADQFQVAGIPVFGPVQAAARIESSKIWAKQFMRRHNIPTADFEVFTSAETALQYLDTIDPQSIVIKADGLAAGKGVVVPETHEAAQTAVRSMMIEGVFGASGREILIERRMTGEEVSLLAFCDGKVAVPMLPAQDHKRAYDGDTGPNTGGMGAYAPVPFVSQDDVEHIRKTILQPVIDGMRAEGYPYIGVLYAGLMATSEGYKVVEFNCRFGDPETQVVLPLLETDLLEICEACVRGKLDQVAVRWKPGYAVTVVLASGGYPGKFEAGKQISGTDAANVTPTEALIFYAGALFKHNAGYPATAGGRVLNVTGLGATLHEARDRAYAAVAKIHFEGAFYRKDIGAKALKYEQNKA
jgi:phosphoribosylamine--glycine ligase